MDSRYAVVIPYAASSFSGFRLQDSAAAYFLERDIPVYACLNGPDAMNVVRRLQPTPIIGMSVIYGGEEENPYPARSLGMRVAFGNGYEAVALLDGDCVPQDDYDEVLQKAINRNGLYAGTIKTKIPETQTLHFDLLREAGFECYDGFRPIDVCVGANMIVGRNVYDALGDMRPTRSGGDADYSVRGRTCGCDTTPLPEAVVYKTINGMTAFGVLKKQILRGFSDPHESQHTYQELRVKIANASRLLADRIDPKHPDTLSPEEYANIMDAIFDLTYQLGRFARRLDVPTRSDCDEE